MAKIWRKINVTFATIVVTLMQIKFFSAVLFDVNLGYGSDYENITILPVRRAVIT